MITPAAGEVQVGLETVGDSVVDLVLVRVGLRIARTNAFGDDTRIAPGVDSVLAVLALHTSRGHEQVPTESTVHDVVELALDKLVAVYLLALSYSILSVQA